VDACSRGDACAAGDGVHGCIAGTARAATFVVFRTDDVNAVDPALPCIVVLFAVSAPAAFAGEVKGPP
jgi:hypothetical protein